MAPTQPTILIPTKQDINGSYNEIRILNADVSSIRVNGNYNTVSYSNEDILTIKENGSGNEIETY